MISFKDWDWILKKEIKRNKKLLWNQAKDKIESDRLAHNGSGRPSKKGSPIKVVLYQSRRKIELGYLILNNWKNPYKRIKNELKSGKLRLYESKILKVLLDLLLVNRDSLNTKFKY